MGNTTETAVDKFVENLSLNPSKQNDGGGLDDTDKLIRAEAGGGQDYAIAYLIQTQATINLQAQDDRRLLEAALRIGTVKLSSIPYSQHKSVLIEIDHLLSYIKTLDFQITNLLYVSRSTTTSSELFDTVKGLLVEFYQYLEQKHNLQVWVRNRINSPLLWIPECSLFKKSPSEATDTLRELNSVLSLSTHSRRIYHDRD